jgi:hypothetical protein
MTEIKRGTKVFFQGRQGINEQITYVWAMLISPGKTEYVVEHPQGQQAEYFFSAPQGPGFIALRINELDVNRKYLKVTLDEINVI